MDNQRFDEVLVSIITVTYNDYFGLVNTIESIGSIASKFNFEHVIIDGASTDHTIQFLSSYIKNPHLPTRFTSEADRGIYDAMNKGVKLAKGEFCFFLNSGDLFDTEADLTSLFKVVGDEGDQIELAGFAFNVRVIFGKYSKLIRSRNIVPWNLRMPTIHQGILYKTGYLKNKPYNDELSICADFESVLTALDLGLFFSPKDINFTILCLGGVSTKLPYRLMRESSRIIFRSRFHLFNRLSSMFLIFAKVLSFQIYFHTLIRLKSK
jgi:putative colanic acid biosynthesis glycosyltransferase